MRQLLKRVLKESGIYSLSPIMQKMIGFFLIPLYTAFLTPADYGNLEYIVTIGSFLLIIASGGLETGFFKYGYGEKMPKRGEILFNCILANLLLSALIFLFTLRSGSLFFHSVILFKLLLLYLIGQIVFIQSKYILLVLRYTHRPKLYVSIATLNMLLLAGFNIFFVAYYKLGLLGIILSNLIVSIIIYITFFFLLVKEITIKMNLGLLKKLFVFGLPMVPGNISGLIMTMADRIFLKYYSTATELGLYGYGYKFGMILNSLIIIPFFLGWGPYKWDIYKMENGKQIYARFFGYLIAGLLILVVALNLVFTFLGSIMASNKEFTKGLVILPLILTSYFFLGATTFQALGVFFKNKTYLVSVAILIAAGINIILNYLLIPKYGMIGAAIATIISYASYFVIYYKMNQKYYFVPYNKVLLIFIVFTILIFSFGMLWINMTFDVRCSYFVNFVFLLIIVSIMTIYFKRERELVFERIKMFVKNVFHY